MVDALSAITAIRDADAEGFVTSTLFSQGWNIHHRALDFEGLISYIQSSDSKNSQILISTDCEGFTAAGLAQLRGLGCKVTVFQTGSESQSQFSESIKLPSTSLDLISLMRGSLRSPMVRPNLVAPKNRTAKVVAIGSVSGGVGCSTFSVNLMAELSALDKKVLIVDAHSFSPSLAALLGQRGLNVPGQIRAISQNVSAIEFTQDNVVDSLTLLEEALAHFDFIVIDLGLITDLSHQLSGRRWSSQSLSWVSNSADSLIILAPSDRTGLERLRALVSDFSTNAIRPTLTFIHALRQQGKREQTGAEKFLQIVTPLRPAKIVELPFDSRSVLKAENEESSLIESNDRGVLRRKIAELAGELVS